MARVWPARFTLLTVLGCVLGGCVGPAPTATVGPTYATDLTQAVGPSDLVAAGVVSVQLPSDAPPAVIPSDAAISIADTRVDGGSARGPVIAVARATGHETPGSPIRTVWVVAYGPGGLFQPQGPGASQTGIHVQIVLVDDQSGNVLGLYVLSG